MFSYDEFLLFSQFLLAWLFVVLVLSHVDILALLLYLLRVWIWSRFASVSALTDYLHEDVSDIALDVVRRRIQDMSVRVDTVVKPLKSDELGKMSSDDISRRLAAYSRLSGRASLGQKAFHKKYADGRQKSLRWRRRNGRID